MANKTKRLTARFVETTTKPGMYADGDGLYLIVGKGGAKRWTFIFQWAHKRSEMGLGSFPSVGLADARSKTVDARRLVSSGQNPIEVRTATRAAHMAGQIDFGTFADEMVEEWKKGFRNTKHQQQWTNTLRDHAASLRPMRLDEIDTEAVLSVLKPLWDTKQETASRLRGRIERILDAAKVKGLRSGENPARWRGHLSLLLPKRQKLTRGHHAAMPYVKVPAFCEAIRASKGMGAQALRLLILTACRTGEVIGAQWSEFDLSKAVWTIPDNRMKAGREHRVPLTEQALDILKPLYKNRTSDFVFPGLKRGSPISGATMTKALNTNGGSAFTVHGFRSGFRDWVGEETRFPEPIAEAALAHVVGDATERAYRRGDALEKRRKLMEAWADYTHALKSGNVVNMQRRA